VGGEGRAGGAQQHSLGLATVHNAGGDLSARRVDQVGDYADQPIGGHLGIELSAALTAADQRADGPHCRLEPGAQVGAVEPPGVDQQQPAVAADRLPGSQQDAFQGLGGVALLRTRGFDSSLDFLDRALGQGVEQRLAAGEVVIEGRAGDPRVCGHPFEAHPRLVGEELSGGIEDAIDIPARIGADRPGK